MADDAQTVVTLMVMSGSPPVSTPLPFYATKDAGGNYSLQSTPRIQGAQVDDTNPMPTALPPAPSVYSSQAEDSHVLKAAPGTLYAIQANATETGWVLLFDGTAAPEDGAVIPRKAWFYNSQTQETLDKTFNPPLAMVSGAVLVFSSTGPFVLTAAAAAQFSAEII